MARKKREGFGYSVVDMLTALCVGFLILSMTVSDSPATTQHPGGALVGEMSVQLTWDLSCVSDVDLWVTGPHEPQPVGYLNPHGVHFDLIRDDRGAKIDPDSRNMEMTVARDLPAGEVIINAVEFQNYDNRFPVPVKVEVRSIKGQTFYASGTLTHTGQEITLMRLRIDANGQVTQEPPLFETLYGGELQ